MKILINGNMGYIGPIVARHLRTKFADAELVGFDSGYFAGCLVNPMHFPEVILDRQHFGDVRDFPRSVLSGVDAVVQLAAISNDPMGKAFEQPTSEINFRSCIDIAAAAKAAGVPRFVFASSCSVYGAGGDTPRTENDPVNPLTAYARSKIEAEQELAKLADDHFTVTCFRFATACGFSPRLRLDLVLNDFAASALATGKITVLSDGTPWRPLIHVRDMARAMEWGATRDSSNGGPFLVVNAGADEWNYKIRDLAEAVCREVSDVDFTINADAPPDKRSYRVNFSRFRELAPEHQPQETLRSAVNELLTGLKEIEFSNGDFRNSRFVRLHVLSDLRARGQLTESLQWRN